MKFTEEQKKEIRKFFSSEVSVDLFESDLDKLESLIFNNNSIPIEPPVKPATCVKIKDLIYIFNAGYMRGHNSTVEGNYIDIHPSDMDNYHYEDIIEIIEENKLSV